MDLKNLMSGAKNSTEKSDLFGATNSTSKPFDDMEKVAQMKSTSVTEIVVRSGAIIDSVAFVYGNTTLSHGGKGGTERRFKLAEGETIIKVAGDVASFSGKKRIKSLTFYTNKGRSFGTGSTNGFSYEAKEGSEIVALFGNADSYLDNIGFYSLTTPKMEGFPSFM